MTRHTCIDCGEPIPNGEAHIRSRSFRQVAYCSICWAMRTIVRPYRRTA